MTRTPGADALDALERLAVEGCRAAREGDLPALEEGLRDRRALLARIEETVARAREQTSTDEIVRRLEKVLELDREAERHLALAREDLEARVASMTRGEIGLGGYAAGGRARGKRVDERR
jgi:hypothetical protein